MIFWFTCISAAFHHTKFYFKGLFDIVVNAAAVINADNWERNVQVNLVSWIGFVC